MLGSSLALAYMGTPIYEEALRLAEEFTDDFETQEQFIEGALKAYTMIHNVRVERGEDA